MKLIFLGTGHGVPETDRHCSSALLCVGGQNYMIDAGAPVADLLIRHGIPYGTLRAVFITHRHADHVLGLTHLLNLSSWKFTDTDYDVYLPEQGIADAMRALLLATEAKFHDDRLRMHAYAAGQVFEDENIRVTAIPTNHMNGSYPSYAFVIDAKSGEDAGKRIVFTGDLHHTDAADFPAPAKEEASDAVVSELVHFGIPAAMGHWSACRTRQLFVTHYSQMYSDAGGRKEELLSALASLPFDARITHDGEEYDL